MIHTLTAFKCMQRHPKKFRITASGKQLLHMQTSTHKQRELEF